MSARHDGAPSPRGVGTPRRTRLSSLAPWAEMLAWSLLARALLTTLSLPRTLALLDRLPRTRTRQAPASANAFPPDRMVRFAGACLGRSLARSVFLRRRGVPHAIVIGTSGNLDTFQAHAWIEPFEPTPEGFANLWRIER